MVLEQVPGLKPGRPRMIAEVCFFFLIVRDCLGGIKSGEARAFILESVTIRHFLASRNIPMPSFSSSLENVNYVSIETLDAIFDAQVRMIKDGGLDNFQKITSDSTACRANSRWPTDSHLILFLSQRLWRFSQTMAKHGLSNMEPGKVEAAIKELHDLNFRIAMASGKKNAVSIRKDTYQDFIDEAEVLSQVFRDYIRVTLAEAARADLLPSRRKKMEKKVADGVKDLALMMQLIINAATRVLEERKVPGENKIASITDEHAAFISKGQRETVVGYRPQISKSERGFVTALIVPEGNAADSGQVMALHEKTVARTGVIPEEHSFDDGYTAEHNRAALLEAGVKRVSFSGSKGKKIIPQQDWESEPYREARRMRSAVESVVYQLKQGFGLGEIMRRTIEKVREEMTWKVLAFNFYRSQYLLR